MKTKKMKIKQLFILGFLLITSLCFSQKTEKMLLKKVNINYNEITKQSIFVPNPDTIALKDITLSTDQKNGWALNGTVCAGCPSYYYKIFRSINSYKAENGIFYYYFYFYFCSNSFLANGELTGTYLTDIDFFANGISVSQIPYLLLNPKKVVYGAWIRTTNLNSMVSFKITKISVY